MSISVHRLPTTLGLCAGVYASLYLAPAHATPPALLGGVATQLACSVRAIVSCVGEFCYDSRRDDAAGLASVVGPHAWAFEFDLKNRTASVGEDYAKDPKKLWAMQGLEESPAVVNKPMFVKFNVLTDTQKLSVMIVATPLPEAQGYSFGYGVVSRPPDGGELPPGIDKTINSGTCATK